MNRFLFVAVVVSALLFSCSEQDVQKTHVNQPKIHADYFSDANNVNKFPNLEGKYIDEDLLNVNKVRVQLFLALRGKSESSLNEEAKFIMEAFKDLDIEDAETGTKLKLSDFNDEDLKVFLNFYVRSSASFDSRYEYEKTLNPKYINGLNKALNDNVKPLFDGKSVSSYSSSIEDVDLLSRLENVSADMLGVESEIEDSGIKGKTEVATYGGDDEFTTGGLSDLIECLREKIDHPGYIFAQNIVGGLVGKHAALVSNKGFNNKQIILDQYDRLPSGKLVRKLLEPDDYSLTISIAPNKGGVYNEPLGVWSRESSLMPVVLLEIGRRKWRWRGFKSGFKFIELDRHEYEAIADEADRRIGDGSYLLCPIPYTRTDKYNCSSIVYQCVKSATKVKIKTLWMPTTCYNPNTIINSNKTRVRFSWKK